MSDIASVSLPKVGPESSDTSSSSGSSKGDRSTNCVLGNMRAVEVVLTLLLREVDATLTGGRLLGRYGGGASSRLLPSANGSRSTTVPCLLTPPAEVIETRSDVSMPVKYAPLLPDGIGPRMIGCEELAVGGWLEDGVDGEYCGSAAVGGGEGGVIGAKYGIATDFGRIFISSLCSCPAFACVFCRLRLRRQQNKRNPMRMTTTGVIPAAAYIGPRLIPLSASLFCISVGPSLVGVGEDTSSKDLVVVIGDEVEDPRPLFSINEVLNVVEEEDPRSASSLFQGPRPVGDSGGRDPVGRQLGLSEAFSVIFGG